MDEETLSHFKVKSKPWTRKHLDIKTGNKKAFNMDENIFIINLRVDDHHPKPFKVISLRRQVYESSILKHGRGECKENLKKWSKTTDPQIKKIKNKNHNNNFFVCLQDKLLR